ncbi:MAG: type II toxin-antitoxin system RelE/ParE family toxin [Blastochloris sp.]|nr:type II toxin-antitoxin system RelE/ParE family toxin [Blastochloris sp.]
MYDYIRENGSERQARNIVAGIYDYCHGFTTFPHRSTRRDELMPGLRTVGWQRRATIAFTVAGDRILILRILFRERDHVA